MGSLAGKGQIKTTIGQVTPVKGRAVDTEQGDGNCKGTICNSSEECTCGEYEYAGEVQKYIE